MKVGSPDCASAAAPPGRRGEGGAQRGGAGLARLGLLRVHN